MANSSSGCLKHIGVVFILFCLYATSTVASAALYRARLHASLAHVLDFGVHATNFPHIIIRLHEPPLPLISLSPHLPRAQAREAVAYHLQQHRRVAQSAVRDVLSSESCDFFWITNRISCFNTTRATLRILADHPDVALIHLPSAFRRPISVSVPAPPFTSSAPSAQPNIHQVVSCLHATHPFPSQPTLL